VYGDLARSVARCVQELERVAAHPKGEVAGEDDVALVGVCEVVLPGGEDRLAFGVIGWYRLVCFFSLVQKNVLDRRSWNTREELRIAIVTWIERT